jgi:hypothetical protein
MPRRNSNARQREYGRKTKVHPNLITQVSAPKRSGYKNNINPGFYCTQGNTREVLVDACKCNF